MKSSNRSTRTLDRVDDLILIGKVVGVHGLRGVVRVYSFAESADLFAPRQNLILVGPDSRRQTYEVLTAQAYKHFLRVGLNGVATREQAEALRGYDVFIPKSRMPPLDEGTYYWVDLLGLEVVDDKGVLLGCISAIIPTGANDVYVVQKSGAGELLIPAVSEVVLDIDLQHGRMRVALPAGLE